LCVCGFGYEPGVRGSGEACKGLDCGLARVAAWLDLDYVWTYSSGPGDLLVEAGDGTSRSVDGQLCHDGCDDGK